MRFLIFLFSVLFLIRWDQSYATSLSLVDETQVAIYSYIYYVPLDLLLSKEVDPSKVTITIRNDQGRLYALLEAAGLPGFAGPGSSNPYIDGVLIRQTAENHRNIQKFFTQEFGDQWRIVFPKNPTIYHPKPQRFQKLKDLTRRCS